MLGGSSGATIVEKVNHRTGEVRIVKTGKGREREQGEWLRAHAAPCLPFVHELLPDGYVMEKLCETQKFSVSSVTAALLRNLEKYVWRQEGADLVTFNANDLAERVAPVIEKLDDTTYVDAAYRAIAQLVKAAQRGALHPGLTHGDPTVDNAMRRGDQLVITDPLPARSYVGDLIESDVGKVLQSVMGYESDRYDTPHMSSSDRDRIMCSVTLAYGTRPYYENFMLNALCFTYVHLLRAMPYQTEEVQQRLLANTFKNTVSELTLEGLWETQ